MKAREWLAREVEARGISAAEMDRRLGWAERTTGRVLSGRRAMNADELREVLALFGRPDPLEAGDMAEIVAAIAKLGPRHRAALRAYLLALSL